ncbi:hypothetical protein Syun_021162 [Stephania yunnanensis]|uniref:Uncharacterized protein n=1 Tax=Stephania yunnanensis TaxID=152371 RepID=A0AAP0IFJ4_9MAGN
MASQSYGSIGFFSAIGVKSTLIIMEIKPPSSPAGRFTQILSVGIGGSALGPLKMWVKTRVDRSRNGLTEFAKKRGSKTRSNWSLKTRGRGLPDTRRKSTPKIRYGNGASIFTTSGIAARKFQNDIEAGQVRNPQLRVRLAKSSKRFVKVVRSALKACTSQTSSPTWWQGCYNDIFKIMVDRRINCQTAGCPWHLVRLYIGYMVEGLKLNTLVVDRSSISTCKARQSPHLDQILWR